MTEEQELLWLGLAGVVSLAGSLGFNAWWRRRPAPAEGQPVTVLLSSPNVRAGALPTLVPIFVGLALAGGVPVAVQQLGASELVQFLSTVFAVMILPPVAIGAGINGDEAVRRAAPGRASLEGTNLVLEWGEQARTLSLTNARILVGKAPVGPLGGIVLRVDDRQEGPDGESGAARLLVELGEGGGIGFLRRIGMPDSGFTMPPEGVPVFGFDATVRAFVERLLARAQEVRFLGPTNEPDA